jgi:hypothetical protein
MISELAEVTRDRDPSKRAHELPTATRVAVGGGSADLARAMIPDGEPLYLRSKLCIAASRAILAEADGDLEDASLRYVDVARAWQAYGCPLEEAHALVGAARCLNALGRAREASAGVERARALARSLGARPILEELEALDAPPGSSARLSA